MFEMSVNKMSVLNNFGSCLSRKNVIYNRSLHTKDPDFDKITIFSDEVV